MAQRFPISSRSPCPRPAKPASCDRSRFPSPGPRASGCGRARAEMEPPLVAAARPVLPAHVGPRLPLAPRWRSVARVRPIGSELRPRQHSCGGRAGPVRRVCQQQTDGQRRAARPRRERGRLAHGRFHFVRATGRRCLAVEGGHAEGGAHRPRQCDRFGRIQRCGEVAGAAPVGEHRHAAGASAGAASHSRATARTPGASRRAASHHHRDPRSPDSASRAIHASHSEVSANQTASAPAGANSLAGRTARRARASSAARIAPGLCAWARSRRAQDRGRRETGHRPVGRGQLPVQFDARRERVARAGEPRAADGHLTAHGYRHRRNRRGRSYRGATMTGGQHGPAGPVSTASISVRTLTLPPVAGDTL